MYRWNFKHAGIENSEEYINQSEEKIKQDCESKAFVRLAKKIKESFPRLPIIITADGLYVSQKVIQICTDNGWDYIIRYKEGCAPSIAGEYRARMQLEWAGTNESLSNGADSRFHKATLWVLLFEEKWNKKTAKKYISWIISQLWSATNENRRYKSGAA